MSDSFVLDLPKVDAFAGTPIGSLHKFYLSGEVKKPDEYIQWFDIIRNCSNNDIVKIYINSPGGDLFTAIQFMRVLGDCEGKVITSVEGSCMSAATLIFLCADQFEISNHSVFMFHNYSTIMGGKGGELYDSIMHERRWSEKIWREVYDGILTESEIQQILDNKDIWMDGDTVQERLEAKIQKLQEQQEEADGIEAEG